MPQVCIEQSQNEYWGVSFAESMPRAETLSIQVHAECSTARCVFSRVSSGAEYLG